MTQDNVMAQDDRRQQVLTKAVFRAAEILGLTQAALAKVIGISAASVSRMRAGDYQLDPNGKEWELSALLVRLYRGLDAIMAGDETALRAWMRNPNSDLHKPPVELIANVTGLTQTLAYVDAYRARV
ncbi:MAG: hypothetical protein FD165_2659 [Gammaproteobacteria bacterium]|nr:MAG: hypothetical protein FD165_2659 [Gammaproteobacteria bacterium]TND01133.1 MAG: hypothetical protein FD120_2669 [Gammaproteobacteria bacterium]